MSFFHSLRFGAFGTLLALAAVPTSVSAAPTMYSTYSGWSAAATAGIKEIQTLCTVQYIGSCATPQPDLAVVSSVPLRYGVTLNNNVVPANNTMKRNIVGTDWTAFWPNGLVSNTTYTGDVWNTKASIAGVPVTSISLTLSSPLAQFGFVALPQDQSLVYDMTVTLLDASNDTLSTLTEVIGPNSGSTSGTPGTCVGSSGTQPTVNPCGFFGYSGGDSVKSLTVSFALDNVDCIRQSAPGSKSASCPASNGGLAIGDFVVGANGAAVPEPATLALLGGGLVALGAVRRRRRS